MVYNREFVLNRKENSNKASLREGSYQGAELFLEEVVFRSPSKSIYKGNVLYEVEVLLKKKKEKFPNL